MTDRTRNRLFWIFVIFPLAVQCGYFWGPVIWRLLSHVTTP
jgi:hypothetical protein